MLDFQWKQRVLSSYLVRIINLHVRFSTKPRAQLFSMYFADGMFVNDFVAMLFSKGRFNVSGLCCRNIVVGQQDPDVLIKSTSWCRSNGHVGVYQMAFNSKNH